jgi:catechol 2,3-dioxygenase-like lactoylglutathione lyase family enzyme
MQPSRIFETVLYAEDLAAAERFYHEALGLEVIERGNLAAVFRCGGGVLLIFDPRKSGAPGRDVPAHGTSGAGHVAFAAKPEDLRRGGSNCVRLESRSNERLTGPKVGVRSIFVTQRAMWLSWLHQPFGVAVGNFDSDDAA